MAVYPLSQTKLNMYTRCPFQFECRYIKGLILPPAAAPFAGGTIHEALAENFRFKKAAFEDMPFDMLLDIFSDKWERRSAIADGESAAIPEIDWGGEDEGALKDTCYRLLKLYRKEYAPLITPQEVEYPFDIEVAGKPFSGRLDLITRDDARIIDYKTVGRKWADSRTRIELQPFAYAMGVLGAEPADNARIDFEYYFLIKSTVSVKSARLVRDAADIRWFVEKVRRDIQGIEGGLFPKRPNELCQNYCGYRQSQCGLRL